MSPEAKFVSGIILLTIPTIEFGGAFLLSLFRGLKLSGMTDTRMSFFRAGHAHAGVLVLLALIIQPLVDQTTLSGALMWLARLGPPSAAILVSAGFFAAVPPNADRPGALVALIYAGALLLAISLVIIGLGLVTAPRV